MAEPAHTPGPWVQVRDGRGAISIAGNGAPDPVTRARYLWVARVMPAGHPNLLWEGRTQAQVEADARVIEHAPGMYRFLRQLQRGEIVGEGLTGLDAVELRLLLQQIEGA